MKIISKNNYLVKELIRCIKTYDQISFAVAWASSKTMVYEELLKFKNKMSLTTIGTHFYQTDPQVIKDFINSDNVKIVKYTGGVYHPKLYLFVSDDKWEAFIGSANLTKAALNNNKEVMIHLTASDDNSRNIKKEILTLLNNYHISADFISAFIYNDYLKKVNEKKKFIKELNGNKRESKSVSEIENLSITWKEYLSKVKKSMDQTILDGRLQLLDYCRLAFNEGREFKKLNGETQRVIAGLCNKEKIDWKAFGSMYSQGRLYRLIGSQNTHISNALSHIPLKGHVTQEMYLEYIETVRSVKLKGIGRGILTRLLAMKRPDTFVCLNNKNCKKMCEDFGIKDIGTHDYERYWNELITKIHASKWFQEPKPDSGQELEIWKGRVALLDNLYFEQ